MGDAVQRQRLLAILAADAAGYSRLMGLDERATVTALDAAREVFTRETQAHQGRIVDTAGDSVLAVFDTALGAADAALAIQRQIATSQSGVAPDRRMDFRIGVHLGDVIEKPDGTIYGNGVNVAARLQSLAEPGDIWVSDAVRGAMGGQARRHLEDQGRHAVKNIDEPVHAFRLGVANAPSLPARARRHSRRAWLMALGSGLVVAAAPLWLRPTDTWRGAPARGAAQGLRPMSLVIGRIAVPPADGPSADAAERLRQELSSGLSGPDYRNSLTLLALPDAAASASGGSGLEGARAARARFLLEGSLRRNGDSHVASLRVVDIESGAQKWSGEYLPKADDGEGEHARAMAKLVGQIGGFVFMSETQRVLALPVAQLVPEELWFRGGAVYDANPTLKGIDDALAFTNRALSLNPNLVPALNMKAFLLLNRYDEEPNPDHERYATELDALTARALALDSRDPYVWCNRGFASMLNGRWTSAAEAIDRLAQIDPGSLFTLKCKADAWLRMGRPGEVLQMLDTEPVRSSDGHDFLFLACVTRILLGQDREAVEACERALAADPKLWSAHLYLAAAHANLGDLERARASLKVVDEMSPGHTIKRLRSYRHSMHPEYQRLAELYYYPGLRKAGMPER